MPGQSYQKVAQLASQEYSRSKDLQALHQQFVILYHANYLLDFEKVVEGNEAIPLGGKLAQPAALSELITKVDLQLRNISQANFQLSQREQAETESAATMYLESFVPGLEAKYSEARVLLGKVNQTTPMKFHVLGQLTLACKQICSHSGTVAYLKAALRVVPLDNSMKKERESYAKLGVTRLRG